jgi:O-antigen ligase
MRVPVLQAGAQRLACYAAIALGASLPLSTALDSVLLGLILLCWLIGGRYREKMLLIRDNPVALAALALFGLVLAGLAWGSGPIGDGVLYLKKYSDLILIALLVTLFTDPKDRARAILALAVTLALTLLLSFALWLKWLPAVRPVVGTPEDPSVFKSHLPHNILMAFGALLFAVLARNATTRGWRLAWAVLAAGAAVNVMLMVKGRTGYVLLAAFTVLLLFSLLRWRGVIVAAVLVAAGFVGAYEVSSTFQQRMNLVVSEVQAWRPGTVAHTSVGVRLEFYRTTLEIIREHPLLGVGTAGFTKAYDDKIEGTDLDHTRNPHNLYLLVTAQFGLVGLGLLLFLFVQQWRYAGRLAPPDHALLARCAVLTLALGGLFNSMIIDHTESLFFAWMSGVLFAGLADPEARPERRT